MYTVLCIALGLAGAVLGSLLIRFFCRVLGFNRLPKG